MALQNTRRFGITAALAGLGALLAGCASQTAPLALACEPNQRALVRQVTVNGVAQPQLECSSAPAAAFGGVVPAAYTTAPTAMPVGYYPQPQPAIADAQFVRAAYQPAVITRPVASRVAYQPAARRVAVRPKRSVAKSAVIVGSSAGVGAGIG